MYKKVKFIFLISFFLIFSFLVINYYFSDQNVKKVNKSRSSYLLNLNNENLNIPVLKNDTNNAIEYKDDVENYIKGKKKYTFWELLKKLDD
jgi:hypothetical protein|tara:strand:+ start:2693 stop:2965 length:273 start_codon:yes stop_codon:yes gene_type:complete